MKLISYILLIQGIYYFISGMWPLLDIDSFMLITGPKTDIWLVKTVGVLVVMIALALLSARHRQETGAAIIIISLGSAVGLAIIDIIYSLSGRISKIYLADACIQAFFIISWVRSKIQFTKD